MVTVGPVELTSRDIAALFWWGVIAALVVGIPAARSSAGGALRALLRLAGILLLFTGWVSLLALLAARVPFPPTDGALWDIGQLKETVAWFFVAGLAGLLFDFPKAASEEHFYLRRILATVSGAVLLDFYLGLVTFPLIVEIALPIPIVLLALFTSPLVVKTERGRQRAHRARVAAGLLLIAGTGWLIIASLPTIDWGEQLRDSTLAAYLSVGALPFVAWLSLYSEYQQALSHMRRRDGRRALLRAKLALFAAFRGRARELHRFVHPWSRDLAEADGFRASLAVVSRFRVEIARHDAAERTKANDLVRYAGVYGTDAEGRRLDRREFEATREALEWLASVQSGAHRSEGRYDRRALRVVQPGFTRGLPDEHGIMLRVRKDGQAWFAWRRTVSGWVFAVGASGPPADLWYCDGPEPPNGYPGADPCWPSTPFEQGSNWTY